METIRTPGLAGRRVANLTWHGIGNLPRRLDPGEDEVWVGTAAFERTLDLVTGRTDVAVTFDDGNSSDVEIALPRLRERGLHATFFVLAGRLGQPGMLSVGAVRELADAGMTIGSHGWAHRDWRALRRADVDTELRRAPAVLAEISGQPVDSVAIPFGSYDRTVLARLRAAAVSRVYTSDGGRTRAEGWLQGRTSLRRDTTATQVAALIDGRERRAAAVRRAAAGWLKRNRV